MSKVKYTKKMKDFLTLYGIEVEPVTKGKHKYSPEAIQFFQDQNDLYEFTIEDNPVSGSFTDDTMEYGEMNNSDYFID
jgi:predicted glycosyltransferase